MEWGEILVAQGRKTEAALHLSVGAMMLARVYEASVGVEASAAAAGGGRGGGREQRALQGEREERGR